MGLTEIGYDGVNWILLPQDRGQWRDLLNIVLTESLGSKTGGKFLCQLSYY